MISEEAAKQCDQLQVQKELLSTAQPLHCEVDRNLQVFQPTSKIEKFNLPDDFFNLTADEVKREQKMRCVCICVIVHMYICVCVLVQVYVYVRICVGVYVQCVCVVRVNLYLGMSKMKQLHT